MKPKKVIRVKKFYLIAIFALGLLLGSVLGTTTQDRKVKRLINSNLKLARVIDEKNRIIEEKDLHAERVVNTLFEWDRRRYIQLNKPMVELLLSLTQ